MQSIATFFVFLFFCCCDIFSSPSRRRTRTTIITIRRKKGHISSCRMNVYIYACIFQYMWPGSSRAIFRNLEQREVNTPKSFHQIQDKTNVQGDQRVFLARTIFIEKRYEHRERRQGKSLTLSSHMARISRAGPFIVFDVFDVYRCSKLAYWMRVGSLTRSKAFTSST